MKLNRNDIEVLIEQKYIMKNKHPELDLFILNYSKSAQFEKVWNEYTLMARGLVVDADFNVVARPFPKFFNIEEHKPEEIPTNLSFEVFDKMDGSLGIIFFYQNEWHVATRGSFVSDQAIRAKEIFDVKFRSGRLKLNTSLTYLVEIIYPENRIVVDYNSKADLVLLAIIDSETGVEIPYKFYENSGFNVVKRYDTINDVNSIRTLLENNVDEGVIVRFSNGFRIKIKWKEYCRLHSIVTNVSTKIVWEYMKEGRPFDELIEKVPDEFFNWIEKTKTDLNVEFTKVELIAYKLFYEQYYFNSFTEKKDFALAVVGHPYASIAFKLYDKKSYDQIIWKIIEPEFAKPFSNDDN